MFLSRQIEEGQQELAQKIQTLLDEATEIKLRASLFVPKDNKRVLLEPQLFSYFNSNSKKRDDISRILFSYTKDRNTSFSVYTDARGMIDISNYGYLLTNIKNKKIKLLGVNGKIEVKDGKQKIQFRFEPITYVDKTSVEIRKYPHPFYEQLLRKTEEAGRQKLKSEFNVSVEKNIELYLPRIEDSFKLIKKVSPLQYEEILRLCRTIVLLKGTNLIAFTAFEMHGVVFLRPRKSDTKLFFVEHIIHEVSHIALNSILLNIQNFFTINPFEERFSSPFRKDLRGVYQVIQAAFVLAKIAQFFSEYLSKSGPKGKGYYETVGRIMLSLERLKEALSYIDDKTIYTKKGLHIYNEMSKLESSLRRKHSRLFEKYVISNQKIEFDLQRFLKLNKIIRKDGE